MKFKSLYKIHNYLGYFLDIDMLFYFLLSPTTTTCNKQIYDKTYTFYVYMTIIFVIVCDNMCFLLKIICRNMQNKMATATASNNYMTYCVHCIYK